MEPMTLWCAGRRSNHWATRAGRRGGLWRLRLTVCTCYDTGVNADPSESRVPRKDGVLVSSSLAAFAYIRAHPDRAALLFVSSVCVGLALTLCALVARVSCARDLRALRGAREPLVAGSDGASEDSEDAEGSEHSSASSFPRELSGLRRTPYPAYTSIEVAELAERIERREQIIQEIWMNSGLDASVRGARAPSTEHSASLPLDVPDLSGQRRPRSGSLVPSVKETLWCHLDPGKPDVTTGPSRCPQHMPHKPEAASISVFIEVPVYTVTRLPFTLMERSHRLSPRFPGAVTTPTATAGTATVQPSSCTGTRTHAVTAGGF
ncbi:LOW QUALITY PROTEIN: protein eva-1 homolog C [Myotis lucifugus]|uniref:LOW QUALITY PROTEIN: protein eva-1 homolog C n=1 Tax=Myotis lucifugus TaxID=59463 RepID=UPI000CCC7DD5|nr:LOW QUALITY PROTEIN: protein eva-1 homolog C [Myotis lucifugus]